MMTDVLLRDVIESDLSVFYENQLDTIASRMAAFTAADPADRAAFDAHWTKIRADSDVVVRTILFESRVAGHVARFVMFGQPEVTYWIGREFWGRGVATRALTMFLGEQSDRPLHARTAADNHGSIRVLQKCGFVIVGRDRAFARARNGEIEEILFKLA